jgi:hypothetical protein
VALTEVANALKEAAGDRAAVILRHVVAVV